MHTGSSAKRLAATGLFAALTFLATFVLKIPTPAFGYIHIGDGFALMSGLLLGPVYGGLAAGIGSALSDLLGGYIVWIPGTFAAKFLTAFIASHVLRILQRAGTHPALPFSSEKKEDSGTLRVRPSSSVLHAVIPSGIAGELVMTVCYFLYNILIVLFAGGETPMTLTAAAVVSAAEIPFNLIQGLAGILLCAVLYPVFAHGVSRFHLSAF